MPNTNNCTVIIAEQKDSLCELIKNKLDTAGPKNQILRFQNGRQLSEFLFPAATEQKLPPDRIYVLLLNINLPGIDTLELLGRITRTAPLKKMLTIVMAESHEKRTVEHYYNSGCNFYVELSDDDKLLHKQIEHLIHFISLPQLQIPEISFQNVTEDIKTP